MTDQPEIPDYDRAVGDAARRVIRAAIEIAPWVSASLSELKPGHTGEYEQAANELLETVESVLNTFQSPPPPVDPLLIKAKGRLEAYLRRKTRDVAFSDLAAILSRLERAEAERDDLRATYHTEGNARLAAALPAGPSPNPEV